MITFLVTVPLETCNSLSVKTPAPAAAATGTLTVVFSSTSLYKMTPWLAGTIPSAIAVNVTLPPFTLALYTVAMPLKFVIAGQLNAA